MALNTFASFAMPPFVLAALLCGPLAQRCNNAALGAPSAAEVAAAESPQRQRQQGGNAPAGGLLPAGHLAWGIGVLLVARTLTALCTVLCAAVQRRHLMVWGLFAPRLVFEVCILAAAAPACLLCAALCRGNL